MWYNSRGTSLLPKRPAPRGGDRSHSWSRACGTVHVRLQPKTAQASVSENETRVSSDWFRKGIAAAPALAWVPICRSSAQKAMPSGRVPKNEKKMVEKVSCARRSGEPLINPGGTRPPKRIAINSRERLSLPRRSLKRSANHRISPKG